MKRVYTEVYKYALVAAITAVVIAFGLYSSLQRIIFPRASLAGRSKSDECTPSDTATGQKTNPNKLLFMNCGGFFD